MTTLILRRHYRIVNPTDWQDLAEQVNTLLAAISDRLDQMEGFRGSPALEADLDLQGHNILNVGTITADSYLP